MNKEQKNDLENDPELYKTVIATTVLYCKVPENLLKKIYDSLKEFY